MVMWGWGCVGSGACNSHFPSHPHSQAGEEALEEESQV